MMYITYRSSRLAASRSGDVSCEHVLPGPKDSTESADMLPCPTDTLWEATN